MTQKLRHIATLLQHFLAEKNKIYQFLLRTILFSVFSSVGADIFFWRLFLLYCYESLPAVKRSRWFLKKMWQIMAEESFLFFHTNLLCSSHCFVFVSPLHIHFLFSFVQLQAFYFTIRFILCLCVCVYVCLVSIGVSVAICCSSVSSCQQVVQMDAALKPPDKPGSEKRDLMTLLPFSVTFFSSPSSYRNRYQCFPALHSNVGQRLHTRFWSRQARSQGANVTLCQ